MDMIDERALRGTGSKATVIFEYIKDFIAVNQYPPTRRDIQNGCEISSVSIVSYHLYKLEKRGLIQIVEGVARGIRIL